MKDMFYEQRPQIYFGLAFYSLVVSHNSALMILSGVLMLACAALVTSYRLNYRRQMATIDPVFRKI